MTEELQKKVDRAIKLLQSAEKKAKEFNEPVEVCYSGGKDSDVILELARMAEINHKAIYKNTTIDPPGTIKHALDRGAEMVRPKRTFFQIMQDKGIPSRFFRFCCGELKEYKILNVSVIGIRRSESPKRAKRYKEPEQCLFYHGSKKEENHVRGFYPILDWTNNDVDEFIKERGFKCAPTYYDEQGNFHVERRLGCMCCPLQSKKKLREEFKKYPKMLRQWANRGGQWLESQRVKNGKTAQLFNSIYQILFYILFCENMDEFRQKVGATLFDDGLDCKKFLEDYFKIKFKD